MMLPHRIISSLDSDSDSDSSPQHCCILPAMSTCPTLSATVDTSRSLKSRMIRERDENVDVWKFYKEHGRIGEGSIGNVSLVTRRRGTEGGSAYNAVQQSGVDVGCGGVFSCWPTTRKKKARPRRLTSTPREIFALKSIHLRLLKKENLDELRNEIAILKALDHPNIVKAYEVYEGHQNIYVVMEHCSGGEPCPPHRPCRPLSRSFSSLSLLFFPAAAGDLYARAPYAESQVADVISQLCSAISYMHKNNVVHRDLKVENIMFESRYATVPSGRRTERQLHALCDCAREKKSLLRTGLSNRTFFHEMTCRKERLFLIAFVVMRVPAKMILLLNWRWELIRRLFLTD